MVKVAKRLQYRTFYLVFLLPFKKKNVIKILNILLKTFQYLLKLFFFYIFIFFSFFFLVIQVRHGQRGIRVVRHPNLCLLSLQFGVLLKPPKVDPLPTALPDIPIQLCLLQTTHNNLRVLQAGKCKKLLLINKPCHIGEIRPIIAVRGKLKTSLCFLSFFFSPFLLSIYICKQKPA